MSEELSTRPPHSALADSLESRRTHVLAAYRHWLEQTGSPLRHDPAVLDQILEHADQTLGEVTETLRNGSEVSGEGSMLLPRDIGVARASAGAHPSEMIRAAAGLFKIFTAAVADCAGVRADAPLALAVLAVNQSMSMRIREAIASYYGFLLDKLHQAHTDERRHLARDLHDRVSAGIGIAFRQLELHDMSHDKDPAAARRHVGNAHQALIQAMHDIRQLTAELRLTDPFQSLEKNLLSYLESTGDTGVDAEVIVNGDEARVRPDVRDEVFLTVREALRNALRHGDASAVRVRVDIAPHELRATVDDDGAGFDPDAATPASPASGGTGIPSMKERIALLGGTIRLSSLAGMGTNVEIHVPLTGAGQGTG